jgi:4-amino-4-deoxy-L-arabinose transferase-like glycosyltransferase
MSSALLEQDASTPASAGLPVPPHGETWRRSTALWPVLAALALRIAFLFAFHTYAMDHVGDSRIGGETSNIAISIVAGHGFSSVLHGEPNGPPTAWIAPAYPYFVALVFRFLGAMSRTSVIFIFAMQSVFSALTVIPILGIAGRTVGRRAGLWSAWIWALFPWFGKWSVTWLWDMSLSALLLALLFWYALKLPEVSSRKSWIGFGALWGAALLVNPSLGALLPVSLVWCGYELYRRGHAWLRPVALSVAVCLLALAPWLVRNRVVFGQWVFLRSNFGFEFALGNYHGSLGRGWGGSHPSGNEKEFQKYTQMGEIPYIRYRQGQSFQFVREYPGEFLSLTLKRMSYFWDGSSMDYLAPMPWYWLPSSYAVLSFLLLPALLVASRRNLHALPMFFGLLLLYPVPYYLTFMQARYRHPIEPVLVLLVSYLGVETLRKVQALRAR